MPFFPLLTELNSQPASSSSPPPPPQKRSASNSDPAKVCSRIRQTSNVVLPLGHSKRHSLSRALKGGEGDYAKYTIVECTSFALFFVTFFSVFRIHFLNSEKHA